MKRILLCLTIIFTVISSGMMHIVFHVCTTEPVVSKAVLIDCCSNNSPMPECCEADDIKEIEPAFCCENVQWYYFTPKFNEGFNKQLNVPIAHFIQLGSNDFYFNAFNEPKNTAFNQNLLKKLIPPNLPWQEDICVWTI